jgi:hypothetical protein
VNIRSRLRAKSEGEAVAASLGPDRTEMDVCEVCGAILHSAVISEPHRAGCSIQGGAMTMIVIDHERYGAEVL